MIYPQNGDRIVTIDSVTSIHPVYIRLLITMLHCALLSRQVLKLSHVLKIICKWLFLLNVHDVAELLATACVSGLIYLP